MLNHHTPYGVVVVTLVFDMFLFDMFLLFPRFILVRFLLPRRVRRLTRRPWPRFILVVDVRLVVVVVEVVVLLFVF